MSTNAAAVGLPCPLGHVLLAVIAVLPLVVAIPTNINIVATAALAVYVGCWRSVKPTPPEESMSRKDAMKFPFIGSAVLFSLFILFKVLPKELVNAVLTAYFVLLGTFAVTATILPFLEALFPVAVQEKTYKYNKLKIPFYSKEPLELAATVPELVGGAASLVFCVWYYQQKHWLANNTLGLAFSIQGIEHLSLGAVQTGVILLAGLFLYDIFWVFCTPVMVSVAKSFDAPIKLLFPRVLDAATKKLPFAMLGLGDIVIPGIFVALILRYDAKQGFQTNYFRSAFAGYVAGLVTTIAVMNIFEAAQPALLYIVPAVLLAVFGTAAARGEFGTVFGFSEAKEDKENADSAANAGEDPGSAAVVAEAEQKKVK